MSPPAAGRHGQSGYAGQVGGRPLKCLSFENISEHPQSDILLQGGLCVLREGISLTVVPFLLLLFFGQQRKVNEQAIDRSC